YACARPLPSNACSSRVPMLSACGSTLTRHQSQLKGIILPIRGLSREECLAADYSLPTQPPSRPGPASRKPRLRAKRLPCPRAKTISDFVAHSLSLSPPACRQAGAPLPSDGVFVQPGGDVALHWTANRPGSQRLIWP